MLQSTTPDRSITVSQNQKAGRRPVADESVTRHYRGRDRVVEMAVRNADRDGVRRCQCPDCRRRRAQTMSSAVAR